MSDTIQLTAAELEMIQLKREKEAIQAREQELQYQKDLDTQIQGCAKRCDEMLNQIYKRNECISNQFNLLNKKYPGEFVMKLVPSVFNRYVVKYTEYDHEYSPFITDIKPGPDSGKEILHTETRTYEDVKVVYLFDNKYYIYSDYYAKDGYYRPGTRSSNRYEIVLKIHGDYDLNQRRYKNILSAAKVIIEKYDIAQALIRKGNLINYTIDRSHKILEEKYPDAESVKVSREYVSSYSRYRGSKYSSGEYEIQGTVMFKNGLGIQLRISENSTNPDQPHMSGKTLLMTEDIKRMSTLDFGLLLQSIKTNGQQG